MFEKSGFNKRYLYFLIGLGLHSSFAMADNISCTSLQPLSWLYGEWVEQAGNRVSKEQWNNVSPKTLEGSTQVINDGKESHFETIRIVEMSGAVFYIAKVPQNPLPVAFKLIHCSDNQFFFENLTHDFPNRIDYHFINANKMRVDVSDKNGKGFSVNYKKQL